MGTLPPPVQGLVRFRPGIRAPPTPVHTLDEIVQRGDYHPSIEGRLQCFQEYQGPPDKDRTCREAERNTEVLRKNVRAILEAEGWDALVYPSWSYPPRLIEIAYGYEEATHHRNPPASTPPLVYPERR